MGAAAHVFVEDLERPQLDESDRHHLERVLRLRVGEEVTVSDGSGGWRRGRYAGPGRLELLGDIEHLPPPSPAVTVAFALTKAERPEWVVQKLTEAGVDRIVPVVTARAVVRWEGEKGAKQVGRLRAVARAAAMQSRRAWLPAVNALEPFAAVVTQLNSVGALAQPGGAPPSLSRPAILIGPEGGWSDEELACGLPSVSLGPTVLRAETAAFAAGFLLCALRARIVAPLPGG
ncbi:MAG TPA: RsmE family RNA methyltransferase [Acidimicrobiales bacterium]|nr:RsmE family RNA methyltransferase [Acidimicrobiales bacterium]